MHKLSGRFWLEGVEIHIEDPSAALAKGIVYLSEDRKSSGLFLTYSIAENIGASTLDRYADMALYMGLLVYYSVSGRTPYVVLAAVATAGSVMVSYARARAESLIPLCKVGFMERPERLVLLIIGGLFNRMAQVLWVIAIVSTITVIHRIYYTWQETKAGRILPGLKMSS